MWRAGGGRVSESWQSDEKWSKKNKYVRVHPGERCAGEEACCSEICACCAGACASGPEWALWAAEKRGTTGKEVLERVTEKEGMSSLRFHWSEI